MPRDHYGTALRFWNGSKTNAERDVDLLPQALDAPQEMKAHTFMLKVER